MRGRGGRFLPASATRIRDNPRNVNLGKASSYELRELSGHGIVLEAFHPESDLVRAALAAAAEVVVEAAMRLAPSPERGSPFSTGALVDSLQAVLDTGSVQVIATGGALSWVTGEPREYGNFVERGGRTPVGTPTSPQPFLEPAFLNTRLQQLNAAAAVLRAA